MLTELTSQCPYLDCKAIFTISQNQADTFHKCPACKRFGSLRTPDIVQALEAKYKRMAQFGAISGGTISSPEPVYKLQAIVEDVRSLGNVGSIFRAADGAGFSRLFLCGITGCPPAKALAKTSLGAENFILWEYHTTALAVIPRLKSMGVKIIALETCRESIPLAQIIQDKNMLEPFCLIVGNEVTGISREALDSCDLVCHLPMRGKKESLNVAIAFAIAAYLLAEKTL